MCVRFRPRLPCCQPWAVGSVMRTTGQADGPEATGGRQWARADATRQALLTAAPEVFVDRGYAEAGIAEIVERSGISVGSLYHHYGGKAGLCPALWGGYTRRPERAGAPGGGRGRAGAAAR